jgi:hypothetical protein
MPSPRGGYRLKNGDKVPSVTTISNRFKESGGLLQWAFERGAEGASSLYEERDQAGDVGTFVHLMWENFLRNTPPPEFPLSFTPEMRGQALKSLQAAKDWYEDLTLKIQPLEVNFVSEMYKFGGTPDAHGMGKRGGALVDWKTGGRLYVETWMQMSAYIHLLEECAPDLDLSDGVHVIRFGKVGGEFMHVHRPSDDPVMSLAWEQFVAFIPCFHRDKQLRKLT